jgi:thioredoxin-related protein
MNNRVIYCISRRRVLCTWITVVLSLLFSVMVLATNETERDPREFFFTQTFGDLPEELDLAKKAGKTGVLLFFEAEGCPYCEYMLKRVFNQIQVQEWYQERFLSIAVDIHGDVELKDFDNITLSSKVFSEQRRVFLTPVILFIDLNGNEIYRHLGMIKTPEEFLGMGQYIEGKHYYNMEFKAFAKRHGILESEGTLLTPARETEK